MADKRDDFWDIGMLLPERKLRPYVAGDTSTCEIDLGSDDEEQPRHAAIPARHQNEQEGYSYNPTHGSIKSVRIEPWQSKYSIYTDFALHAREISDKKASGAEYVYFFSYRSQYSELSCEQMAWYLTWRGAVREGNYTKTGLSYILLYVYEMINLSDYIEPVVILERILQLWINYRDSFSRLDKYLSEWVIDFALIHQLEPDLSVLEPFIGDIMSNTMLKEFYLDINSCIKKGRTAQLIALTSGYNYKDSKFYTGENTSLFDTHIPEMLRLMLSDGTVAKYLSGVNVITSNVTREAFTGAVCAFKYKKKILCRVYSYLRSYDFKQLITGAVKYSENAIRGYLGIKSRLYQIELADEARSVLDTYIRRYLMRPKTSVNQSRDTRENEAPTPPREINVNLSAAAFIEQESWDTTRKLVELQEEDGAAPPASAPEMFASNKDVLPQTQDVQADEEETDEQAYSKQSYSGSIEGLIKLLDSDELDFLRAALIHNDEDRSIQTTAVAARCRSMPELLTEKINEKALDIFGDILIDMGACAVLEDYYESVKELIDE